MALIAVTNGFVDSSVFDNGLSSLTSLADNLHICSQSPTTYTEATSTYTLGNETGITVGSPTAGVSGRKVVVSAITGGDVTGTGTATHYAIVDVGTSLLMATGSLSASQAVTSGNTFDLTAIDIEIPAAS